MGQERKNGSAVAHGSNSATFEQQFGRLQEVVQRLSDGNLTLQEALSSFEEGMALADNCSRMLEEAELRVQQVSERAARSGTVAAAELDLSLRAMPAQEEPELLTFEIETYETTVLYEEPVTPAKQVPPLAPRGKGTAPEKQVQNPTSILPLDPLFDEDD
ncbi:MAG: exodeoxyribonuclease small subunit [Chloroflexia bacterium]|jgi:exodeoxyribonuclease VII small subunit|nr:exodeoxyribonuclease small subunit [Chloroflexia bacterium]